MHHIEEPVLRSELMMALSKATDLAMGQPVEQAIASAMLASRLGEQLGLPQSQIGDANCEALLHGGARLFAGLDGALDWSKVLAADPTPKSVLAARAGRGMRGHRRLCRHQVPAPARPLETGVRAGVGGGRTVAPTRMRCRTAAPRRLAA
jgi:hypothetical protein